tara:strand:- start:3087 stop:3950 length:864 start_codon:yes stop_codon:yes gene_type:complete
MELSDRKVYLVAPSDSVVSDVYTHTFTWEEMQGATHYQLRIASPNFNYIEELVLDSNVSDNEYTYNLYPGTFQWGVRGVNGSSYSQWTVRTIEIDSSLSLIGNQPTLQLPFNNYLTNQTSIDFNWLELINANAYQFKLVQGSSLSSGLLIADTTITDINISIDNLSIEGSYVWGVRGMNDLSNSDYATRVFELDLTAPSAVTLTAPANNNSQYSPVEFSWLGTSETVYDTLEIATDSLFNNFDTRVGSDSLSYTSTLGTGTYYWRVIRSDEAGNSSSGDNYRRLIVQ